MAKPQTAEGSALHQHNLISKGHFYFFSCFIFSVITQISPRCVNRQLVAMNRLLYGPIKFSPKREQFYYVVLNLTIYLVIRQIPRPTATEGSKSYRIKAKPDGLKQGQ